MDWLTSYKIPLGNWIAGFVDFLNEHAAFAFNFTSDVLGFLIDGLIDLMQACPPLLLVAIFAGTRLVAASLDRLGRADRVLAAADHQPRLLGGDDRDAGAGDLRDLVCMLVGVPVGIAAAHRPWLYTAIRPVLDLMQTIPTFVYLIPALILFGLGVVPGLISTDDLRHPGAGPPDLSRRRRRRRSR